MILTYDLYGTLVDVEKAIVEYFKFLSPKIDSKKARELYNEWNDKNFENINSKKISFKESATEILTPILKREGLLNNRNIKLFLVYYSLALPFPEVFAALKVLKAKNRLVIISNIDNDLIKQTLLNIPIRFDDIITSEDAGYYYKPQEQIFSYALKRLKCNKKEIIHTSSSNRADIEPAVALGWKTIFINRKNQKTMSSIIIDALKPEI